MRLVLASFALLLPIATLSGNMPPIQTVFIIVMENHDWSDMKGNTNAPYLNNVLLPMASYCEQYYTPPRIQPSLPNYLWLEAGTNFGILDDNGPSANHQCTTAHLVAQLRGAGISWKTYQEDISGTYVPLTETNAYAPRHNPFVYFDDVTGTNNPNDPYGIAHIRPYSELETDLTGGTVASYNFITPNLCNDGHDACSPLYNPVRQTDNWLAARVPVILASAAYQNDGAMFVVWDEDTYDSGQPIGMIVVSPLARGSGYYNNIHYTHSSTLCTFQEIFGVGPPLGDAANATDLSDLFSRFEFGSVVNLPGGGVQLTAVGVVPGRTNLVLVSGDLTNWMAISTNTVAANTFTVTDWAATNLNACFYRLVQLP
jgi:phosphatidylinositol-3-phosphatase